MNSKGGFRSVNCYDRSCCIFSPFKQELSVRQKKLPVCSGADFFTFSACLCTPFNKFSQLIPIRAFYRGAERAVTVCLFTAQPPFASIIDAGSSRHGKQQAVCKR